MARTRAPCYVCNLTRDGTKADDSEQVSISLMEQEEYKMPVCRRLALHSFIEHNGTLRSVWEWNSIRVLANFWHDRRNGYPIIRNSRVIGQPRRRRSQINNKN